MSNHRKRGLTTDQMRRITKRNVELGLQPATDLMRWNCTIRKVEVEGTVFYVIGFDNEQDLPI